MMHDILNSLDAERQSYPERGEMGNIVRDVPPGGTDCTIVYSRCTAEELDHVIQSEITLAHVRRRNIEWKVYGHDGPPCLRERLVAAGFSPQPVESFMVLPLTEVTASAFPMQGFDIRQIRDAKGLADIAAIAHAVGHHNAEDEVNSLAAALTETPGEISIHAAYDNGKAVACGRSDFRPDSVFVGLFGGRTDPCYRGRGLYTALVGARLREAMVRHRRYAYVDALPTSEPILKKRGFVLVTQTQPFVLPTAG